MAELIFNDQNFSEWVLKSDLPVLVDFWAPWCAPCKMIAPIISQLAEEYKGKIKIGRLNVDGNQATAQKYGIMGIPTMILFEKGKEVKKIVGLRNKESLIKELELT